jgi:aryl-alcohol dehydrogenase-like predicted oxidoreductase
VFKLLGIEYGDRAQAAIRFSLANPNISCVVIGLAEIDHLKTALAAEQMGPLPATAVAQLRELYGRNFG